MAPRYDTRYGCRTGLPGFIIRSGAAGRAIDVSGGPYRPLPEPSVNSAADPSRSGDTTCHRYELWMFAENQAIVDEKAARIAVTGNGGD